MKHTVIDYRSKSEGGVLSAEIVSFKGYESTTSIPEQPADVARVIVDSVEVLHSMGPDLLDAVWSYKAKRGASKPTEPAEMAEQVWEMLNPKPKAKKEAEKISGQKELQSPTGDGTSSSVAGDGAGEKKGRKKMAKAKKASKKAAKKSNGAKRASTGPRGEKTLAVKALLERKSGCTRKDILDKTGWPAVSVQAMAKAAGLKLRKVKEPGKATVYFGS